MNIWYCILYSVVWPFFNLFYPYKAYGRENVPVEGGVLLCSNHTSLSDPLFIAFALQKKLRPRIMAKAELFRIPILGFLLKKAGIFGVDRGKNDVKAVKTALKTLKSGGRLLLFPQGTRVRGSDESAAKTGAVVMALRSGVPIVPIWLPAKKRLFHRTPVVFGAPYYPQTADKKTTTEENQALAEDLMAHIFALEGTIS